MPENDKLKCDADPHIAEIYDGQETIGLDELAAFVRPPLLEGFDDAHPMSMVHPNPRPGCAGPCHPS